VEQAAAVAPVEQPAAVVEPAVETPIGEHVPEPEGEPPKKKANRVTAKKVASVVKMGANLPDSIFRWKDWESLSDEVMDVIFFKCEMLVDVLGADGAVVLAKGTKVNTVEWYASRSSVVFYPTGAVSSAVVCSMHLEQLRAIPLC
jgi:hypothetical protein